MPLFSLLDWHNSVRFFNGSVACHMKWGGGTYHVGHCRKKLSRVRIGNHAWDDGMEWLLPLSTTLQTGAWGLKTSIELLLSAWGGGG